MSSPDPPDANDREVRNRYRAQFLNWDAEQFSPCSICDSPTSVLRGVAGSVSFCERCDRGGVHTMWLLGGMDLPAPGGDLAGGAPT